MSGLLAIVMSAGMSSAMAGDEGPDYAYGSKDNHQKVVSLIDGLLAWAEGELAEHELEGLYEDRPGEEQLVREMIARAKGLRQEGRDAEKSGLAAQAQAYFYAAEATARYAANMPHLLEARLAE